MRLDSRAPNWAQVKQSKMTRTESVAAWTILTWHMENDRKSSANPTIQWTLLGKFSMTIHRAHCHKTSEKCCSAFFLFIQDQLSIASLLGKYIDAGELLSAVLRAAKNKCSGVFEVTSRLDSVEPVFDRMVLQAPKSLRRTVQCTVCVHAPPRDPKSHKLIKKFSMKLLEIALSTELAPSDIVHV